MAKRKGNLKREAIKEEMVLIEGSNTDYITPLGNVYKLTYNGLFLKKEGKPNIQNGYIYIGITMNNGKNKSTRVHRLVAKAFIDNPNQYDIVGHKDNNKANNCVDNLYWTTIQENTQKAFDDGLAINAQGYNDSQSYHVIVYDLNMNELYRFGSVSICSKELKISKNAILCQCKGRMKTKPRCGYYFKFQNQD